MRDSDSVDPFESSGKDPSGAAATGAQSGGPASIRLCRIVSVWTDTYTVDVKEEGPSGTEHEGVPFASLYSHDASVGGAFFMPEVDSHCFIAICADRSKFVFGFLTNPDQPPGVDIDDSGNVKETESNGERNFRLLRPSLEPGDIYLGSRDGNRVVVRTGGVVQIASTSLAQRLYIPVENIVRDYFQRYQAYSPVGEIEWGHAVLATGEDISGGTGRVLSSDYGLTAEQKATLSTVESTPVLVKYNIKDLAQEDVTGGKYSVEVRVGRLTDEALDTETDGEHLFAAKSAIKPEHTGQLDASIAEGERGIVSITIYSHDITDTAGMPMLDRVRYSFQLNRDGDNFIYSGGHLHMEIAKTAYLYAEDGIKAGNGAGSYLELTKDSQFKAEVEKIVYNAVSEIMMTGSMVDIQAPDVKLGQGGGYQNVVRFDDLKAYLASAVVTTPAGAGAIITPLPDNVGSSKVKVSS